MATTLQEKAYICELNKKVAALEEGGGGGGGGGTFGNPTALITNSPVNGVATTYMRSDAAPALDMDYDYPWNGRHIFNASGSSFSPAVLLAGAVGTGANSYPQLTIEPSALFPSSGWSTLGTMLGVNAGAGFAGNLIDLQVNGVSTLSFNNLSYFRIKKVTTSLGQLVFEAQNTTGTRLLGVSDTGVISSAIGLVDLNASVAFNYQASGDIVSKSTGAIGFSAGSALSARDTSLTRLGAANLRLGNIPSATPLAQTFTLGEASRPGTDSNVAGANGTIQSGLGTGTGLASSLIFQTPSLAGAGSGVQSYTTRMVLDPWGAAVSGFLTATNQILGSSDVYSGISSKIGNNNGSRFGSPSDGVACWTNSAGTDFNRLQLGGTTASFPAIKRNGAGIDFRLADDTAYCNIAANGVSVYFGLFLYDTSFMLRSNVSLPNGAAAASGTLTNVPVAGNPTKWIPIYDNGTTRYIPAW